MARYELLDEIDLPFPLGGCFGYWGYDLKNFVEPCLRRSVVVDLDLPDCYVCFCASLVVFDHRLEKTWIVSTGVQLDGSRDEAHARRVLDFWRQQLASGPADRPLAAQSFLGDEGLSTTGLALSALVPNPLKLYWDVTANVIRRRSIISPGKRLFGAARRLISSTSEMRKSRSRFRSLRASARSRWP